MDNTASILSGAAPEAKFASDNGISQRTVARYRNQTDGLPYFEFGGRVFIPIEEARAWLQARVKRPNPSRRKVA
jgi:hypothetical protein